MKHCWLAVAIAASFGTAAQAQTVAAPAGTIDHDARCVVLFALLASEGIKPNATAAQKEARPRHMARAHFFAGKIWATQARFDFSAVYSSLMTKLKEPGYAETLGTECATEIETAMAKLVPD